MPTLNVVAVINGTDYPAEYNLRDSDSRQPYYQRAAEEAIYKSGLKSKRNDPTKVNVTVFVLKIVGTELKREKVNTYSLLPPLMPMTDTEFETEQTALLAELPEAFHAFVRSTAWDHGHSSGYEEVINYVRDMVGNLKPAVNTYRTALLKGKA